MALRAGSGDPAPDEEGALVLVVDPARAAAVEPGLLRQVFGLTGAEATVALRVAEGHALPAIADELGVLHSTVRTHLQRVFEKTGTSRQSQVARLVIQCG